MPRRTLSILALMLVTALFTTSCSITRFARTQDMPGHGPKAVADVRILTDGETPTQGYESIGVIEITPGMFITLRGLYKKFRAKAAEAGGDAVMQIRTTRKYYVNVDLKDKRFSLDSYDKYYGDVIVYTHSPAVANGSRCDVKSYGNGNAHLHRCSQHTTRKQPTSVDIRVR